MAGKAPKQRQQQQQPRSRPFRCVIVGDACVGKTWMVMRIIGKKPNIETYIPTIVENTQITQFYRGQQCKLEICDTAGQEEYKNLRTASYTSVDLFVLCFCPVERDSFDNLESIWLPELKRYQKDAKVLLVGTKLDLYSGERAKSRSSVRRGEIASLRDRCGNLSYVECSAVTNDGIDQVMDRMLALLHDGSQPSGRNAQRSRRCNVL